LGQSYRDLIAWQKGIELVAAIYRVTQTFPKDEAPDPDKRAGKDHQRPNGLILSLGD